MQDSGYLAKILVQAGQETITVGQLVAIVVDDKADVDAFKSISADALRGGAGEDASEEAEVEIKEKEPKQDQNKRQHSKDHDTSSSAKGKDTKAQVARGTSQTTTSASTGGLVKATPLAKKTANELGVDLHGIQGSGPGGRILRHNVEEAAGCKSSSITIIFTLL